MARKKTGTIVKTKGGLWQAVITLADGTRKRFPPFPKGTSEARARDTATAYAERAVKDGLTGGPKSKAAVQVPDPAPMALWFATWIADRVKQGNTSTGEDSSRYRLHIVPCLGDKHVKDWTAQDLRRLSVSLDVEVQTKQISWKTAGNVWATATRMCTDATNNKREEIRCRPVDPVTKQPLTPNPAIGVPGPYGGAEKTKEFLYPSEFLAFASCEDVPLEWRRLVSIAVYTAIRTGELRVLQWSDVDLAHGTIHVHRAHNRVTGETKPTKGMSARRVPIELALRPLLKVMREETDGKGLVIPNMPLTRDLAMNFRRWLIRAKVLRAGLHTRNETQRAIVFHDLRGSGLTWMAIRGDDPLKIQQRAGHSDFKTTQGYIGTAHDDGFGDTFPALPVGVITSNRSPISSHPAVNGWNYSKIRDPDRTDYPSEIG